MFPMHHRARAITLVAGALACGLPSLPAQAPAPRLTAGILEARQVVAPDTSVVLTVDGRDLVAELRVPAGRGPHPVAIVIHGGCWVTEFADRRYMRPLAEALRQDGIATWTISYRRADEAGGGWPGTFLDVAAESALLRDLAPRWQLDLTRLLVTGHSAGAHLALWLAAQPRLPASSGVRATGNALPVGAVVALDGPGDLAAANAGVTSICGGAVLEQLLGGVPSSNPERWRLASPSEWLPLGVPQAMVRGGLDWRLPALGSGAGAMPAYAARARAAGDSTWVVVADSTNHFTMLDPERPAFAVTRQAMRDALAAMTSRR
ncbi:MAG: alpha/beta hydrolase [Gemmatimonadaceae bacterium]|nr:alpha/beta hydrolase [Gemmatimonadaceae bacterium]